MFVFVYGTLMRDERLHAAMNDAEFIFEAELGHNDGFHVLCDLHCGFPAVVRCLPGSVFGTAPPRVKGEVYWVPNDMVEGTLDCIESEGSLYYRRAGHVALTQEMRNDADAMKKLSRRNADVFRLRLGVQYYAMLEKHPALRNATVISTGSWKNPELGESFANILARLDNLRSKRSSSVMSAQALRDLMADQLVYEEPPEPEFDEEIDEEELYE